MLRTAGTLPRGELHGHTGVGFRFDRDEAGKTSWTLMRPPPFADPAREGAIQQFIASEHDRAAEWDKKEARTKERIRREVANGSHAIEAAAYRERTEATRAEAKARDAQRTLF
jgi:hypothetical protein